MAVYEKAMTNVHEGQKVNVKGQLNLLDIGNIQETNKVSDVYLPEINEYPKKVKLSLEKDVLGFYISEHPLSEAKERLEDIVNFTSDYKDHLSDLEIQRLDNRYVTMAGIITGKSEIMTKKRSLMAFANIEDLYLSLIHI